MMYNINIWSCLWLFLGINYSMRDIEDLKASEREIIMGLRKLRQKSRNISGRNAVS